MIKIFRHLNWLIKGIQTYALVGKSGTGKSFRAKLVAEKFGIELIIDDGLLIHDQKILAGKSAKKAKSYLGAIKTAVFDDKEHRISVVKALEKQKFKRILILGTSEKMIRKITSRLNLPSPFKILNIEQLASKEEIALAIKSRKMEGKHVIPVPAIEIHRTYPRFVYDSIRVFVKKNILFRGGNEVFEKAIVRPEFGEKGKIKISESAIAQMVNHCIDEFDDTISVKKIQVKNDPRGYKLKISIHIPLGIQMSGSIHNLQEYIIESIERYSGVLIHKVTITIEKLL
jgi:ABC-type dipeptide/oligopeptide/nickel transport system ATPase component